MSFEVFESSQIEAAHLAAAVGVIVLLVLTIPSILDTFMQKGGFRRAIVERHRRKLQKESMQRNRSPFGSERLQPARAVSALLLAFIPVHIVRSRQQLLRAAGYSGDSAFFIYFSAKIVSLATFIIASFFFLSFEMKVEITDWLQICGASGLVGFFAIDFALRWRRNNRVHRIVGGLPDGLDLLVICAEAGLSLDSALRRVADEFVTMVPELAEELFLCSVELNFLPDRRQALVNLSQRIDVPAIRGVTSTLIQTEKYGTPLSNALRTLSTEFRETRLLAAEEKAARLPAILTVPMICFILPALFVVLAAPAFIKVADKFG